MIRAPATKFLIGFILLFIYALSGCSSQSGQTDTGAKQSTTTTTVPVAAAKTISESCAVCHSSDPSKAADVEVVHRAADSPTSGIIDKVTFTNSKGVITMKVDFHLYHLQPYKTPIIDAAPSSVRFAVAQLKKGTGGNADVWQSYINRKVTKASGTPGTAPDGTTANQATTETGTTKGGIWDDSNKINGAYSYTLSFDFAKVTTPVAVTYDETLTHRVAMQIDGNLNNPYYDFRPSDGAKSGIPTHNAVVIASCNECHHRLSLHGSPDSRVDIEYCVTCHNPGSTDPNSNNTVDLKVMIHKIHTGKNLPSVKAGGEYAIWGYQDIKANYSDVTYPQDIRNCTKCHINGSESGNWKTVPTIEACVSCHDNRTFINPVAAGKTLHTGGPMSGNKLCVDCHTPAQITTDHKIPAQETAANFVYKINGITNTSPGQFPEITFSVLNSNGAAYNILKDSEFKAGAASRLSVLIGWSTSDYSNTGSGATPAQPISINALTDANDNGNGTFTVKSKIAIPSDAVGTGVAAIEGHPAGKDKSGAYTLLVPVKSIVSYFPITAASPVARRTVVDTKKCDLCHGVVSLHGSNRNDEVGVCVICHNGNATDINRRPADSTTAGDGKKEETIDFKYMIHAIHAAEKTSTVNLDYSGYRQTGLVIYGYGNTMNDFSDIKYPGMIGKCDACHISGTYRLPLQDNVQTTAVNTGTDLANPADDRYATPAASVCSSCHDDKFQKLHMQQNGGGFDLGGSVQQSTSQSSGSTTQTQRVQPPGHSTAPGCTPAYACHG